MLQRLWITVEFYGKNGLSNHASAGAYGFLLSAAPVLLIIAFMITNFLASSPELAAGLFEQLDTYLGILGAGDLVSNFLNTANPGLAGIFSAIPLFWTARICALSIQRGLGVIFPAPPRTSPFRNTAVSLGMGFVLIVFIFIMLLGSSLALDFYDRIRLPLVRPLLLFLQFLPRQIFSLFGLTMITLVAYRIVPAERLKWRYIIPGALACMIFYHIFFAGFSLIINPDRYNLIYGVLGMLFLFLLSVYFFFIFFLFGAQFIRVLSASDTLLFIRFRQQHSRQFDSGKPGRAGTLPWEKLFALPSLPLEKYIRNYEKGELVFAKGSQGLEVYYILRGKAGVYLDDKCRDQIALIQEAQFFGELEVQESEGRSASIKAETELSVLRLSRKLFDDILQTDPDTDKNIIQNLSERLRTSNKRSV